MSENQKHSSVGIVLYQETNQQADVESVWPTSALAEQDMSRRLPDIVTDLEMSYEDQVPLTTVTDGTWRHRIYGADKSEVARLWVESIALS